MILVLFKSALVLLVQKLLLIHRFRFHPWNICLFVFVFLLNASATNNYTKGDWGIRNMCTWSSSYRQLNACQSGASVWLCCMYQVCSHVQSEWTRQLFDGSVGGLLQGKISVPIQYTLILQWESKFPRPWTRMSSIMTRPTYCIYC